MLKDRQKSEAKKLKVAIEKLDIDWSENPNGSSNTKLNIDAKVALMAQSQMEHSKLGQKLSDGESHQ